MAVQGWKRLLSGKSFPPSHQPFPIPAYSEFMPPPRLCTKPYGRVEAHAYQIQDLTTWPVSEYEEAWQLQPGLKRLGREVVSRLVCLGSGRPGQGLSRHKLRGNPYWPPELVAGAG